MNQTSQKQIYETNKKERFSYGIYFFGQLIVYVIVLSFLQIFLTDIGIPATAVAAVFLIAKIWDAINDPLFGIIVNRVNFKKGKYKPWLKISAFIIPVCTTALFAIPAGLSVGLKIALASVLYIAWDLSYTLCDIPVFSVVTAMTNNVRERTSVIARGRVLMFVGALAAGIVVPILYPVIGWFGAAAILSLIALGAMVPLGYAAKERHRPPAGAENPSIKELILTVAQNKYLLLMVMSFIIANMTNTGVAVSGYFAIYCLGGPQIMSLLSLLGTIPVMVLSALIPALTKKMDKFTLLLIVTGGAVLFSVLLFLTGYANLPLFLVINTLRGLCIALPGTLMPMFILDCAEYGQYKTGKNSTALAVSLQTFAAKVYGALAGAIGMFILGLSGFASGANAVQPPGVIRAIWLLISIAPISGLLIGFIMLFMGYKLRDRDIQIMARVNQGDLSREEAEKLLSPAIAR
ncbi:MAG: glycoside-pentoside-hexuronide (GPH):cation symporter [Spirochaetaceae bacterium]|jgi:sugar (glycoside-pentoside-hexuronide) transporter|nr:glycoside-pentoside-hexuronide (GPH):cation symporter [Spirochaetaceae bacterium]